MTTTTATPPAPGLRWAARSLRWGGRKLTTSRDVLLWAAGFTNPAPRPGTGLLGDDRDRPLHHVPDPSSSTLNATPASPQRTANGQPARRRPTAKARPGRAATGLQQRLTDAITTGPPAGGTWTGRALAEHIGCSRSTAWAALNARRQRPTVTSKTKKTKTRKPTSGTPHRSRGRRSTGRVDRER